MKRNRLLTILTTLVLLTLTLGCNRKDTGALYSSLDLSDERIAILDKAVSDKDFNKLFPHSKPLHFKSSSEFLLSMAIGKCDAGIAKKEEATYILNGNYDFGSIQEWFPENDSTLVITHKRLLPGIASSNINGDLLGNSLQRIDRSLISDNYWKLLLTGLAVTVVIFFFAIILAFTIAIVLTWMNYKKSLKWLAMPLFKCIRTIHDVPSVVLIFFFYYLVFAAADVSGIIVCIIALGVYSSGSFMNIIKVHLDQVSQTQHDAAKMLGLTGWKKYRYIILPQATKPMLPLLAAESKVLLRATSYAGYISQIDLVKVTEIIRNQTYDVLVPLLFVSIVFLALSWIITEGLYALYNKAFVND